MGPGATLAAAATSGAGPAAKFGLTSILRGVGGAITNPYAMIAFMLGPAIYSLFSSGYSIDDKAISKEKAKAENLAHMSAGLDIRKKMNKGPDEGQQAVTLFLENLMGGAYGGAASFGGSQGGTATASEGVGGMGPQILQALSEQSGEPIDQERFDKAIAPEQPEVPFAGAGFMRKRAKMQNPMDYNLQGVY